MGGKQAPRLSHRVSNVYEGPCRLQLTKAVNSCGLEMSDEVAAGFVPFAGAAVELLGDDGPVYGREGVAAGVTLRGSAAEEGGAMAKLCEEPKETVSAV